MQQVPGKVVKRQAIVDVGILRFIPPAINSSTPLEIPTKSYRALIDTGATGTCITPKVVNDVNLVVLGKIEVKNLGATQSRRQYLVNLAIFYGERENQVDVYEQDSVRGYYGVGSLMAIEIDNNTNFDVIIGMDVLEKHELSIIKKNFMLKLS